MPTKKDNFLKRYFTQRSDLSGPISRSGDGFGAAGAMGSGDGYKEKIGREKIPWYLSDFRGQPSMAADSGFSSIVMSRVNKGRDEIHDPKRMFPDQDVKDSDEEDNYLSRAQHKMKESSQKYFNENHIVKNSQYSLSELSSLMGEDIDWERFIPDPVEDLGSSISTGISDNWRSLVPDSLEDEAEDAYEYVSDLLSQAATQGEEAYDLLSDKIDTLTQDSETFRDVKDIAMEVGRDFIALTAAGIPVIGTPLAAAYVLYNLSELDEGQEQARRSIDLLLTNGSYENLENMQRVSGDLFDDYIDLLQASTYLIPFVGVGRGIVGTAGKLLNRTKATTATAFLGLTGSSVLKSAIKSEILLSNVFKIAARMANSDVADSLGLDKTYFFDSIVKIPSTLIVMADIIEEAIKQYESWEQSGSHSQFRFNPSPLSLQRSEIQSSEERLASDDYLTGIEEWIRSVSRDVTDSVLGSGPDITIEAKKMKDNEKILRAFIRESIYHTTRTELEAKPAGWEYRVPPTSDEDDTSAMGSGKDLVNFKTDMGYASYQSRPENIKEQALRRIIRRKIRISESKKK